MAAPQVDRLRGVKTLPQLLAYLRDELDWPIDSDDAESVTFDYDPSELGLDEKAAVRIKEIKQLRPLSGSQPWGIFFVNFEKKRLPVMVMRRILRSLVFKKRNSASESERRAWDASDLLFVSAYGEEGDRAITFAHFVEDEQLGGLAELRVLGWDDDDTPLKYDYVAHTLQERLRWRDEFERDPTEWRKNWRSAFELRHREVITTSKQLASQLAGLAKKIRARVRSVLRYEDGFGKIRKLQAAFRNALIHDLSDDDFADMYAQTITYGLFSAAVSRPAGVHGGNIVDMVPVTNPFLRDMLKTFLNLSGRKGKIDFDELGIQEVVALLNSPSTHLSAVLRDFGNRTRGEDPVIHFYEDFLREYDAKKKIQRGVFYTPQPVVSYIVRSVHELLQTEFGIEDGLASTITWGEIAKSHADLRLPEDAKPEQPFVQILDPATGTATFLVEVIDVIYRHLKTTWQKGGLKGMPALPATSFPRQASEFSEYWNQYVALALLPRLHGYELMMAPYAIAHMKIGLKLYETGYRFGSDERARIYLTNSLEPPQDFSDRLAFDAPALAHEANAVNAIKRHQRFTAVIGNPPYTVISANLTDEARALVDPYRSVAGKRLKEKSMLRLEMHLQDDYIKFFRFSEQAILDSGVGVMGLISNHSYLNNPTLRGMRWNLLQTFSALYAFDLHGSTGRRDAAISAQDENVFDIQQGVAISIHAKVPWIQANQKIVHADLWGSRSTKYHALTNTGIRDTRWEAVHPCEPFYLFTAQDAALRDEFNSGASLVAAMPINSVGIVTGRDAFAIDWSKPALRERITIFCDAQRDDAEIRALFGIRDAGGYALTKRRKAVIGKPPDSFIQRLTYRPFDQRWIAYSRGFLTSDQRNVMRHILAGKNLALVSARSNKSSSMDHFFCSANITETKCGESTTQSCVFPLYAFPDSDDLKLAEGRRPNFSSDFLRDLFTKLNLGQHKPNAFPKGVTPEDIFHYAYAIFHSPGYRSRYAEFLKIDFPRLPLTGNLELFRALAGFGGELVALHLLESPKLDKALTTFIGGRNPKVEKISWSKNTVWIDKAQTTGFKGLPEAVWNFHIGGYQVCEKWLKDRKGRTLSKDDIAHYHKIVIALYETIRLMSEIDKVIEKHGGWPSAFVSTAK